MLQPSTLPDISGFEGPIGLLVELIERSQIEITAVSLERITAEYVERVAAMSELDPAQLVEFIQLSSRLLYIKSLALLPTPEAASEELIALEHDLAEYRRYREAAVLLASRLQHARTYNRGMADERPTSMRTDNISLEQLALAFEAALKRSKPLEKTTVIKRHFDIESVMTSLKQSLKNGEIALQTQVEKCQNRLEIIVTFLAVLELLKNGSIQVIQSSQFSDIMLKETA